MAASVICELSRKTRDKSTKYQPLAQSLGLHIGLEDTHGKCYKSREGGREKRANSRECGGTQRPESTFRNDSADKDITTAPPNVPEMTALLPSVITSSLDQDA